MVPRRKRRVRARLPGELVSRPERFALAGRLRLSEGNRLVLSNHKVIEDPPKKPSVNTLVNTPVNREPKAGETVSASTSLFVSQSHCVSFSYQ